MPKKLVSYHYAQSCPRSEQFKVRVNGENVFVFHTTIAAFAGVSFAGRVEVVIEAASPVQKTVIRPLSRNIQPAIDGQVVRFSLDAPMSLSIEIDHLAPLFFFGNPLEENVPPATDPKVRYFKSGKIHEVGELVVNDGETVYIEGGAVVVGCIHAKDAKNVAIRGRGVLDGSCFHRGPARKRTILMERCEHALVEGVTIIHPSTWTAVFCSCRDLRISNLKEITQGGGSDGIDIVSCRDVVIEDCFLCTGDDTIVVKALDQYASSPYGSDVENVLVQRCVLQAISCGSALEIGHELRTPSVKNITFRDCDILAIHGHGVAMSIRVADRATVSDVLYENIRIEHYYARLFDFRVIRSRYSKDTERGQIRNVQVKNVRVKQSIYNPGYSTTLIGGFDAQHTIDGVVFENLYLDDTKATNADQLDLFVKQAENIVFR